MYCRKLEINAKLWTWDADSIHFSSVCVTLVTWYRISLKLTFLPLPQGNAIKLKGINRCWRRFIVKVSFKFHLKWKSSHFFPSDGEVRLSSTDLHSGNYHIVGVDLRNIDELSNKLQQSEVDFSVPTIFLAECVLVYIEPQNSSNLLTWIASNFKSAVFVNYEQVNMNDRFGEVMLQNLRSRGCSLAGVEACLTLDTQVAR